MLILSGEMTESDFEKELGEIRKMLQESTAGISYEDVWGKKIFAYRIKKQWRGYYVVLNFAAAPSAILEVRSAVKLNQNVLRHLLVSVSDDYVPGSYKTETLPEARTEEERNKSRAPKAPVVAEERVVSTKSEEEVMEKEEKVEKKASKPKVAGKEEEEQLKNVEKKLEKILENPDININ